MKNIYDTEKPMVALASPWGESAIAVIRTSGSGVFSLLDRVFRTGKADQAGNGSLSGRHKRAAGLSKKKGYTLSLGTLYDTDGSKIDEVIVAVFKAPNSYTGEDAAEIYCHGGLPIIKRILNLLLKMGFKHASPGEFTMRAFMNGKLDLTRAEAVNELIRSKTDTARELALERLSGAIERKINEIKEILTGMMASVELRMDYSEDEIEEDPQKLKDELFKNTEIAMEKLTELKDSYRAGKLYQEGITLVLAGRTNAGKSTLFNLLLREERAIVSEIHGTTRDYIEGNITIGGIPVRLFDTAGLRSSHDPVEQEGVKRSDRIIKNADLVLYLVDGTKGIDDEDEKMLGRKDLKDRLIPVWNKCDLKNTEKSKSVPDGFIGISAITGKGLGKLIGEIENRLLNGIAVKRGEPVIDSMRQKDLLEKAYAGLMGFKRGLLNEDPLDAISIELSDALSSLGEITGEVTTEDILNNIFSNFCVGK